MDNTVHIGKQYRIFRRNLVSEVKQKLVVNWVLVRLFISYMALSKYLSKPDGENRGTRLLRML